MTKKYQTFDQINAQNLKEFIVSNPKTDLYITINQEQIWSLPKVLMDNYSLILRREGKFLISVNTEDISWVYGDSDCAVGTPLYRGIMEILWDTFGGQEDKQGLRSLNWNVGIYFNIKPTDAQYQLINSKLRRKGFRYLNGQLEG
jgi:hypothetical protein